MYMKINYDHYCIRSNYIPYEPKDLILKARLKPLKETKKFFRGQK